MRQSYPRFKKVQCFTSVSFLFLQCRFTHSIGISFSSGISSGSLASIGVPAPAPAKLADVLSSVKTDFNAPVPDPDHPSSQNSYFSPGSFSWSGPGPANGTEGSAFHDDLDADADATAGILDDPFDAEWAALAMRNATSKNPFLGDKNEGGLKKAFELQM